MNFTVSGLLNVHMRLLNLHLRTLSDKNLADITFADKHFQRTKFSALNRNFGIFVRQNFSFTRNLSLGVWTTLKNSHMQPLQRTLRYF